MTKVELKSCDYVVSSDDGKYRIIVSTLYEEDKEAEVRLRITTGIYRDDENFCFKNSSKKTIKNIAELLLRACELAV